jgi:hypothetical protein
MARCAPVLDARAYMLALPKDREHRSQWQRAAELLLDGADVAAFSKALELALFMDAKVDVSRRNKPAVRQVGRR